MSTFVIEYGIHDIDAVAKQCVDLMSGVAVITLTGSLGAGKTTLASAMLKKMGVVSPVISPTFTYVNSYAMAGGRTAYHFDLYRLDALGAFVQAGFDEYLYGDKTLCLIEWPDIVLPLLTKSVCHVSIEFLGLEKRRLVAEIKR